MSTKIRMIGVFSFAIVLVFSAFSVSHGQARADARDRAQKLVQKNRSLARFSPQLQRHTAVLQQALTRYMASGDPFTPYLKSKHFWIEVKKSRAVSSLPTSIRRDKLQQRVLWKAYSELETDVLQVMLDDQLALYQHDLDLNEAQYAAVDKILRRDADKKLKLLARGDEKDDEFFESLTSISIQTETDVRQILFPEQLRIYDKRQVELKLIWTA